MTSGPTKAIKAAVVGRPYTIGFSERTDFAADCRGVHRGRRGEGAHVFNIAGESLEVSAFRELVRQCPKGRQLVSVSELPVPAPSTAKPSARRSTDSHPPSPRASPGPSSASGRSTGSASSPSPTSTP